MELTYVISVLHQTVGGQLFMDGMGCSEPILSLKDGKIIDNFLVYFSNFEEGVVSGPVAQVGLQAESGTVEYLVDCKDATFSLAPHETMSIKEPVFSEKEYEEYSRSYTRIRDIAYKNSCSDDEKRDVLIYLQTMKRIIAPEMLKLYEEMVPEFFAWVRKEIVKS